MNNLKQQFIQEYGEAYQKSGLPKLMGRIVGLLLFAGKPISLDDITNELNVSKGPVSQITSRLRDHNLIERVWVPGSRKDHYQVDPDIFGNAFFNQINLQRKNLQLAKKYQKLLVNDPDNSHTEFKKNVEQMTEFYSLMLKHFQRFLDEWNEKS